MPRTKRVDACGIPHLLSLSLEREKMGSVGSSHLMYGGTYERQFVCW